MASLGMTLNIILNIILIPRYEAVGSAISSITTQLFTAFAQVMMARKTFEFRYNFKLIGTIILFIATSILINYYVYYLPINWIARLLIAAGSCFVVAIATKLIAIRNIYHILKYGEE